MPFAGHVRRRATMRRSGLVGLAAALVAIAAPASSQARDGEPDPAFGGGAGWVTTSIPGLDALAYDVTVLRNGKVAVAGQASGPTGDGQIVVARYRRDGRLDPSFGSNGIFKSALPVSDAPFIATSVVQERTTRKLVVGGGYGQGSMLALRLTAGGRLDRTFGKGSGVVSVPVGGIAESLAIQDDNRILLGGSNADAEGRPMVVARLKRGGRIDRSFGDAGVVQSLFWNDHLASSAGVLGIAPTDDGGLVASGHIDYIGSDGHGSAGVFRLDADGHPVQGFGTGGGVEVAFPSGTGPPAFWFPCAMTVDALGRITVTGDGTTNAGAGLLTTRLTAVGAPDPSFGRSGDGRVVTTGPSDGNATTCGAALTANGSLTVGVQSQVAQLTARGARRARFAPGGVLAITQPADVEINAVSRTDSRRVVVAGSAGNDIYVARYLLPPRR